MARLADVIVPLTYFLMHFDIAQFEDEHFDAFGIVCPVQIAGALRKRKAEFLYGRLCARAALRELCFPDGQVAIGSMREPIWPEHIVGSITHSRKIAAAAAVPSTLWRGVGIDIEALADAAALDDLRASVLSTREWSYLCELVVPVELRVLVTLVFSAKESFFKGAFGVVKRYFDFDAIELTGIDWAAQTMSFRIMEPLGLQWRHGDICQISFEFPDEGHVFTAFAW